MKRHCTLILGMHRSGTSAVTNYLHRAGLDLISESLPPHPEDNPEGYFEPKAIVQLNNQILKKLNSSWRDTNKLNFDCISAEEKNDIASEMESVLNLENLDSKQVVIKDPRMCRLLPLWQPILNRTFDHISIIIVFRKAEEIYRSLKHRANLPETAAAAITNHQHVYALWFRYYLDALHNCKNLPHFLVKYDELIFEPDKTCLALTQFLIKSLPGIALKYTEPKFKNNRRNTPLTSSIQIPIYQNIADDFYMSQLSQTDQRQNLTDLQHAFEIFIPALNQLESTEPSQEICASALLCHSMARLRPSNCMNSKKIIYISQNAETRGHIYRVTSMINALNKKGISACWLTPDIASQKLNQLSTALTVIIHRCDWSDSLATIIHYCKENKIPIAFDIDDYLFDDEIITKNYFNFFSKLNKDDQNKWRTRITDYQTIIGLVDYCIVPTSTLRSELVRLNRNTLVVPNGFSTANELVSEHWRKSAWLKKESEFRIGYASGTPTHDADFATIVHPLSNFLQEHSNCILNIIGHLDISGYEDQFDLNQIEKRPMVEHTNFAYELARVDILIIPLERNPFCDSKSNLKWYEAALAGTPCIGTANPEHLSIEGETIQLCSTEDEWLSALNTLFHDTSQRNQLAENALNLVRSTLRDTSNIKVLLEYLSIT